MVMKHLCDKGLTFTAGCSISNCNNLYAKLLDQGGQFLFSLLDLSWFCRSNWIDDLGGKHLSCLIDNG